MGGRLDGKTVGVGGDDGEVVRDVGGGEEGGEEVGGLGREGGSDETDVQGKGEDTNIKIMYYIYIYIYIRK